MTILELFKKVHPSVLAAKMIFKHLQDNFPGLKISDIADTSSGGTPNRGMIEYYNGDIPWVKSGELKDGIITNCDEYITASGLKNSSAKLFPKGTLLVAMYGANIGKTGVLDFDATTNQAVCAIFPKVDISKDFLFWYFKQQRIEFIAIGKGGAQPNISQTVINNASIVVPDPKIQNKIVDFLEAIEQGKGIDNNFFIPEVLEDVERIYKYKNSYIDLSDSFENQLNQIENLNQAILQEAVQGKLVKQDKKDEPASELLKRIKAEKVKSGKKEKPLPPIKLEEIPFEIPGNWVWCRIDDILDFSKESLRRGPFGSSITKGMFIPKSNPNATKVYEQKNAIYKNHTLGGYYIDIEKYTNLKSFLTGFGDIIISCAGTIGEAYLLPKDAPVGVINQALLKIRLNENIILNAYFLEFFKAIIKAKVNTDAKGSAMKNLGSIKYLRENLLIPLPPHSEQKRIVAEIDRQLAKTKQLKEHIIANQKATEQLLKALLHQAFEVEEMEVV